MKITLNLTDEAAQSYAQFYGNEDPEMVETFVTDKLLSSITNDLTEKRNRDTLAAVQEEPLPSVVKELVEEPTEEQPTPEDSNVQPGDIQQPTV